MNHQDTDAASAMDNLMLQVQHEYVHDRSSLISGMLPAVHGSRRERAGRPDDYLLNRKFVTSQSCMTYSLVSRRSLFARLA